MSRTLWTGLVVATAELACAAQQAPDDASERVGSGDMVPQGDAAAAIDSPPDGGSGGAPSSGGESDEVPAGDAPAGQPDSGILPLLCPSCAADALTDAASSGEPPNCTVTAVNLTQADAEQLGYDVEAFADLVEGSFSAPVQWKAARDQTTLSATIEVTTLRFMEREALTDTSCEDLLMVGLRVEIETGDGGLSGTLEGETALSRRGELAPPVWANVRGWQNGVRGNLALRTGELGPPQALELSFNVLVLLSGEARLGVEVLGLYGRDLDSGAFGFTTILEEASPIDHCPAYMLPDGADCATVSAP